MNIPEKIEVPAPSAWPIVLAFGLTLVFAGMVTAASLSVAGLILAVAGAAGWFREVLPIESHEWAPATAEETPIQPEEHAVERMTVRVPRASLPVEIYPISAGVKGGLAGSVVMAGMAAAFGLLSGNGIWYAMNLLVAGLFPDMAAETASQLGIFNLQAFLVAAPIHLLISLLVGLLYGAMLPMASRRPILLGGLAAPLVWSFLIYSSLAVINPVMNQRINWVWFVFSQIGFGVVAGVVVARQERIGTRQPMPLPVRMGLDAPGLMKEDDREETR
ncbi:MAG: hypothetical protein ABSG03_01350 [Bryobacteraceae bacterium]|jgi:hypothetical protein